MSAKKRGVNWTKSIEADRFKDGNTKSRNQIISDAKNIERKFRRFQGMKNKPQALLQRLCNEDVPRIKNEIAEFNSEIDRRTAKTQRNIKSDVRRSYQFEVFIEGLISGKRKKSYIEWTK